MWYWSRLFLLELDLELNGDGFADGHLDDAADVFAEFGSVDSPKNSFRSQSIHRKFEIDSWDARARAMAVVAIENVDPWISFIFACSNGTVFGCSISGFISASGNISE